MCRRKKLPTKKSRTKGELEKTKLIGKNGTKISREGETRRGEKGILKKGKKRLKKEEGEISREKGV